MTVEEGKTYEPQKLRNMRKGHPRINELELANEGLRNINDSLREDLAHVRGAMEDIEKMTMEANKRLFMDLINYLINYENSDRKKRMDL
jgi:hypothetical protein